jgi:hypothetical protein
VLTTEDMRALAHQLSEVYDGRHFEKLERARVERLVRLQKLCRKYFQSRRGLKHAASSLLATQKNSFSDEFEFNKVVEGRLSVLRLSYHMEEEIGVLTLRTEEGLPYVYRLKASSILIKDEYLSEWPRIYFELEKAIKDSELYF